MTRTALLHGFVAVLVTMGLANGQEANTQLVLADGERVAGALTQLDDDTLVLTPEGAEPKVFTPGQWVRWGHPAEPARRPMLYFGKQSILVAKVDWTGKVPASIDADFVTIATTTFGAVQLPRRDARVLLVEAAKEPELTRRLLREAKNPSTQDRVWLVEGDLLTGNVVGFDGTTLDLEFSGQKLPVLASSIAAIAFAKREQQTGTAPQLLVGLGDGSLVEAASATFDAKKLTVRSFVELTSKTAPNVVFVQSLAPEITYLSDLDPVDFRHTPYFTGEWPLGRDRNLVGEELKSSGVRHAKGLAMHSASRAVYRVPEGASEFAADIALDDTVAGSGSVVFRVYLVTADGLKPAYESPVIRGGDAPVPVSVPLDGASALVLIVDYADYGDERDHANWLDARFVQ
ncbi:NPCBM/NEW2 domain-containing protein [Aeoliella sp. SH292]|uniref:NPCBM/NEW2 domain-containing protein n=1 Tax=Aeoliella sp. SH292 TaxID=3454464 RepID=UPI003F9E4B50